MKRVLGRVILCIITFISLTFGLFSFDVSAEQPENVYDGYQLDSERSEQKEQKEQENIEQEEQGTNEMGSQVPKIGIFDYIKVIVMLLFVIGLLYFVLRFLNKKSNITSGRDLIQNLGGVSLGSNKNIQILKVRERIYLVGVGENVTLLKEIVDQEEVEALVLQYNERMNHPVVAQSWISKIFVNGFKNRKSHKHGISEAEESDFKEIFEKQLGNLNEKKKEVFELLGKNEEDNKR